MSANGTAEAGRRPRLKGAHVVKRLGSTMVPPWISGSKEGRQVNRGSRSAARLTFTLRVAQRSMSVTKSPGSSARSTARGR
jgi:hypothetical protein